MVVVCAAAALAGAACRRAQEPGPPIDLTWTLAPTPPVVGPATLTVALRNESGPVPGAAVRVEAHMSHPGMAPVLASATERDGGVYETRLAFTMAGDWVLLVYAKLPDGRQVERRIELAGVRPSG